MEAQGYGEVFTAGVVKVHRRRRHPVPLREAKSTNLRSYTISFYGHVQGCSILRSMFVGADESIVDNMKRGVPT